jgi:excisionase family DNA binding protein
MAGEPEQHTTITIPGIADRLDVCEETVYDMLKQHEIPNIRHGRRFIVSRAAYEKWEATIGEKLPEHPPQPHAQLPGDCAQAVEPGI